MTSAFRGLAASESWANWRKWDRHSDTFVALISLVLALEAPLTTSLYFLWAFVLQHVRPHRGHQFGNGEAFF